MITLPVIIESPRGLKDGSVKISLITQELNPQDAGFIMSLNNKYCYVIISPSKINETEIDIPEEIPEFANQKSLSQRLRNVIYRYWEKLGKPNEFEVFRKQQIEALINQYKEKLD